MLILGVVALSSVASGGLVLTKTCGEKNCLDYHYCSDSLCAECEPVCDAHNNNYDGKICEKECQESASLNANKELQETIEWLRNLVAGSLFLSLLVCLVMVAGLGFLWLRHRRQNSEKKQELDLMENKINTVSGMVNNNCREKLPRLDISNGSNTAAPSVLTAMTPVSTRHPCEDATLEYAYDNEAMSPSPVLSEEKRTESKF